MSGFGNWQQFLDSSLTALASNEQAFSAFKQLKDDYGRICWLEKFNILGKADWVEKYLCETVERRSLKCTNASVQFRTKGNESYKKKRFEEALIFYNESVLNAPTGDTTAELALAYGNRSALFYETRQYELCLMDIELALGSGGYPVQSCTKLYHRRGLCYEAMGKTRAALNAFEEAKNSLEGQNGVPHQREKQLSDINRSIEKLSSEVENLASLSSKEERGLANKPDPITVPVQGYSDRLTCASRAVDMKFSGDKGRHLVANQSIPAGSVLIAEQPYAFVLLPSHSITRCHHCLTRLYAVIGCRRCNAVGYCSERCRDGSWAEYHSIECFYTELLHSVGVAHLALRIILIARLEFLSRFRKELRQLTEAEMGDDHSTSSESVYGTDYTSVYNLMPHTRDMQPEDLFQYSLTAQLLLSCLERSNFFVSEPKETKDEARRFVGSLLIRHICQLVCNAHAITDVEYSSVTSLVDHNGSSGTPLVKNRQADVSAKELVCSRVGEEGDTKPFDGGALRLVDSNGEAELPLVSTTSQERIATAIYPTASLMNHSCDPTIISGFSGSTLIVRAVRDVLSGEEIYNCYGPHCKRMSRAERQESLSEQYFFTCLCTACEKEQEQELLWTALKCTQCEGPAVRKQRDGNSVTCIDCGSTGKSMKKQEQELLQARRLFEEAIRLLDGNLIDEAVDRLLRCYECRRKLLYKHNRDLSESEDALARCYASKGEFLKAERYLSLSLSSVEKLYGSGSIELAHELQKYAELCSRLGVQMRDKAVQSINRALILFELHYGRDCDTVKELLELKCCLIALS